MEVVVNDTAPRLLPPGARGIGLDDLFATADVVSLHVPLEARTRHLVDARLLSRTRRGVLLVNTARPGLVDPRAINDWLRRDPRAGYAVDLGYEGSLQAAGLDLLPNLMAVPHISWYTPEAVRREAAGWVDALVSLVRGEVCSLIADPTGLGRRLDRVGAHPRRLHSSSAAVDPEEAAGSTGE
jgi:phosphoglycerate dehydrogenase-like enzyme